MRVHLIAPSVVMLAGTISASAKIRPINSMESLSDNRRKIPVAEMIKEEAYSDDSESDESTEDDSEVDMRIDPASKRADYLSEGLLFTDVVWKSQVEDHEQVLRISKKQSYNTFSECSEEYRGFEMRTFSSHEVSDVLNAIDYTSCEEPADKIDLKGQYKLRDNIKQIFDDKKHSTTISCQYVQTGTSRVITVKRKSIKSSKAFLDPAMWRRLKSKEGHIQNQARECHALLRNFINIQNGMVEQFAIANPNKDVKKLLMPEIMSSNNRPKEEPSKGLSAGYIVLIIISVVVALALAWYVFSRMSKDKPDKQPKKEENKNLIKRPKKSKIDAYEQDLIQAQPIGRTLAV